jgi:hypothetical protein
MSAEVQEIMDWCDNQCWRFPWARDVIIARTKEKLAELEN